MAGLFDSLQQRWCFRNEWNYMYRSLLDALKSKRAYPQPSEEPEALP